MEFSDSDKSEFEGFSGNDVTNTENALTVVPDSLESVQSFDLDTESDTQSVDISENASSSNNEIDNLLEDIDNLSEDENGSEVNTTTHSNTPEPIQDRDSPPDRSQPSDDDMDLHIDLDNLSHNPGTGDEMFDILHQDPE